MFARTTKPLLFLTALSLAAPALAERVHLPIALDAHFIESVLRERVFTGAGAGGSVRLNNDGSGCRFVELRDPRVSVGSGVVHVRTAAAIRAGRAVAGRCLVAVDWRGELDFTQVPEASGGDSVLLRTTGWQALRPDGSPDSLATAVGGLVEQFMPAELRQTRIGFADPMNQLREFLALMVLPQADTGASIDFPSLALDRVAIVGDRVIATVGLDATPATVTPPAAPEPALSDAELAALEQQLDAVDAFFTYTVKALGDGPDGGNANALLEVLVELRQDLVAVLAAPAGRGRDPARTLFVDAWKRLAPVLRQVAGQVPEAERGVRLLTFIGAGDALRVLDELGPAMGVEVTSDGLRRLARLLVPDVAGDPLARDEGVDPELRRVLGFGPPLPPPRATNDTSRVDRWLNWFIPSAVAAGALDQAAVERLNNWVPRPGEMNTYLPMVRDVLTYVVAQQLQDSELDPAYRGLFRSLVLAAGWQESCWRQFMVKGDKRWPMESSTGDVGLMQINLRVWKGLYDRHGLNWDIVYNARAGADILEHYLINYALRHREHETTGKVDNLARSTYAAYNGGPRQYDRYRRAAKSAGVDVDAIFYEKYQAIKGGNDLAVKGCYVGL